MQDNAVLGMLEISGNNPPYPFEGDVAGTADTMYPGGENNAAILQLHDQEYQSTTTIGGVSMLKGGNFPCGLMRITATNLSESTDAGYSIQVNLVPGHHSGYLCEPMTEM